VLTVVALLATLFTAVPADAKTARGTARGDTLNGTRLADRLDGRGGPDRIDGLAGNDVLDGGAGRDRVRGSAGDDLVRGGGDHDMLTGGAGDDRLEGGAGDDRLEGGAGKDRLDGGAGNDRLEAADAARDVIVCGPGWDEVVVDRLDRVGPDCEVPHRLVLATAGSGRGAIREVAGGVLCPPLCVRDVTFGTDVDLQPEPDEGSLFAGWTGDCLSAGVPCRLTMTQDRSATALFVLRQVPVAVELTGAGSGSVATTPPLIDCGATCAATVGWGATLTLTAVPTPGSGSVFAGWSGDCTGFDPVCVVQARDDVLVSAAFEPAAPQLMQLTVVRPAAGGVVTSVPAGIDCAPAPAAGSCQASFPKDSSVTLTATPAAGQVHTAWTGVCAQVTARTCLIKMFAPAEAGAEFMPGRTLRVSHVVPVSFLGPAVVSQEVPPLISCPGTCEADYRVNASVTLNVVSPLSLLFEWTAGPCARTARTCVVPAGTTSVAFRLRVP
jgi:hypothetical protein